MTPPDSDAHINNAVSFVQGPSSAVQLDIIPGRLISDVQFGCIRAAELLKTAQ